MNLAQLQQAIQNFDEILPIGKEVYIAAKDSEGSGNGAKERELCHIAGMTRVGNQARLYVLKENVPDKNRPVMLGNTNRERMRIHTEPEFFMEVAAIKVGETELRTKGIIGYPLCTHSAVEAPSAKCALSAENLDYNCEVLLVFGEFFKNGWKLPENSPFARKNWEELWVTRIDIELAECADAEEHVNVAEPEGMDAAKNGTPATAIQRLPLWENQEVFVRLGKRCRKHPVEKPVCLQVGKESEVFFSLEDGSSGICYINRVYPIDVWQENEERFKDPRYLEIVTKEELEKHKESFFEGLAQDCPRGMCYLGIEYECTLNGNLVFYDRSFLERKPEENRGSARIMMMLLKPDEPYGKHGLAQHGCVIQTPVFPDIKQMEAELFYYMEMLGEKEVRLKFETD